MRRSIATRCGTAKRQVPGTLLMFRLGDFYELFYEDAVTAARELEITLTSRNKEKGQPIPMCGVPYHAAAWPMTSFEQRLTKADGRLTKQPTSTSDGGFPGRWRGGCRRCLRRPRRRQAASSIHAGRLRKPRCGATRGEATLPH